MELIEGRKYRIEYRDPDYPCGCGCHGRCPGMMHFGPCCHDQSYSGLGTYTGRVTDQKYEFAIAFCHSSMIRHQSFPLSAIVDDPSLHVMTGGDLVWEAR